jgi:hypothetical protein
MSVCVYVYLCVSQCLYAFVSLFLYLYVCALGKRPLARPKHKRMDNIKIDLRELLCQGLVWIQLSRVKMNWYAPVNTEPGIH